ncbi:hypothetical protein ACP4OV_020259 [Aristida adscensionis]
MARRFIAASLLIAVAFVVTAEALGGDENQQTCDRVHFKALCKSLTKLPGVKSPNELMLAAVRVAIGKAKMVKGRVDQYKASHHLKNPLLDMLDTCSKGYDSAISDLEDYQQILATGGHITPDDLSNKLNAVLTSAADCTTSFEERPNVQALFTAEQQNVQRVADNVLAIAVELHLASSG